jgi:hypothetical protein
MKDLTAQGYRELGLKYADSYLKGIFTEQTIANLRTAREILYECYLSLIKSRQLAPIETMTDQEKTELWNECKKYCEPLSKNERIKFVKAYAALGCLMKML